MPRTYTVTEKDHPGATYEDLKDEIDRAARMVAKDYPDIDWEDLRQEIVVFVLENGKSIKLREYGGNPRRILFLLAQTHAKKLRTQHLTISPQYAYKPSDVKLILESAFMDSPRAGYVPDDARSPLSNTFNSFDANAGFKVEAVDPFQEADFIEVASDVKAAMAKLKPTLRKALYNRYVLNIIPENASWERKELNKALNELTFKLNTYRGDVFTHHSRKAISNSAATMRISGTYE